MIEIIQPGLQTTVQDDGRRGYQAFGVPVCGAMDWIALAQANLLAGNTPEEAALELCALGPTVRFHTDAVFALAGAEFSAVLNGVPVSAGGAYLAHRGEELALGAAKSGLRGYLAIAGGLDIPMVMGSRSTCLSAQFGGLEGRALKAGDRLPLREPQLWLRGLPQRRLAGTWDAEQPLRVVVGPQDDAFSPAGLDTFFGSEYRMSAQCDRMGCRMEGPNIALKEGRSPNILSDGVVMGSIQVPNGQPIVMMADRQTTGGYVKLGTVITADLPLLAQKRPGDRLRFVRVTVEDAQQARRDCFRRLRAMQEELERGDLW